MKIEELIAWMKDSGHYLVSVRCSECSTIFLSLKGESWWYTPYIQKCHKLEGDFEIEDDRWVGGSCGELVTVKEVKADGDSE